MCIRDSSSFAGTATLTEPSGTQSSFSVLGRVGTDGSLQFSESGGGTNCSGTVSSIKLGGNCTLSNGASGKFTLIK